MTDNNNQTKTPRRFKWWLIPIVLIVVVGIGGVLWINQRAIADIFEPKPTLPPDVGAAQDGKLYWTDFEDAATLADWEFFDDGVISAKAESGRLVVGVNSYADEGTWSGLNLTFTDFVLDVESIKMDGPDDNGIIVIFRLTDTQNYNRFDISSDGYYAVSKVRNGIPYPVSDWRLSAAIAQGADFNDIRVRAVGGTFSFYVNGTALPLCISYDPDVQPLWEPTSEEPTCLGGDVIMTWEDNALPAGKIGLGAQGFIGFDGENNTPAFAVIGFDNLIIWSSDAPEAQ